MRKIKLKPCPCKCGSTDIKVKVKFDGYAWFCLIKCKSCGNELWNKGLGKSSVRRMVIGDWNENTEKALKGDKE
jgi:hypothetical protein